MKVNEWFKVLRRHTRAKGMKLTRKQLKCWAASYANLGRHL